MPESYKVEESLKRVIRKRNGAVTVADASVDSGLPYEETEIALRQMLSNYKSHLDVDDDGNLRYRFDLPMNRRGGDTRALLYRVGKATYDALRSVFKVATMVILVGYTIAFILLFLALALSGRNENDSRGRNSDSLFGYGALRFILDYFFWYRPMMNMASQTSYHASYGIYGNHRQGARHYYQEEKEHRVKQPFYEKVNRFVFGENDWSRSERNEEDRVPKSMGQYIRSKNGVVTAADWAAQTGLSLDEADNALTAAMVHYSGDVKVTPDGTLLYTFDNLKLTANSKYTSDHTFPYIWEQKVDDPRFTGNSFKANLGVAAMGVFVLISSIFSLNLHENLVYAIENLGYSRPIGSLELLIAHPAFPVVMGYIPLIYAIFFFVIPLLRIPFHYINKMKAEKEKQRREEIRKIYRSADSAKLNYVTIKGTHEKTLVLSYDGEPDLEECVPHRYKFETLYNQRLAGKTARDAVVKAIEFGKPIYSSDEKLFSDHDDALDQFDQKVAAELGGNFVFDFDEEKEEVASRASYYR